MMDGTTHLTRLIRRLERFAPLPTADRHAILALPVQIERIGRGRRLIDEGQQDHALLQLHSGYACRYGLLSDGQRQITGVYVAGDLIGLRSGDVPAASQTVSTLSDADVAKIPHAAIMALAEDRVAIARALWNETILDANAACDWIVSLGRRDARGRVLALLQDLTIRSREAGLTIRDSLMLPLTQEEIGDATGLTSVHVNRTLMALQAEGMIDRIGRRVTLLTGRAAAAAPALSA